jgi:hypothetical protein
VELNNPYCSPNTVRVIKSRRMRWAEYVERMRSKETCTKFWWGHLRERIILEDPGVDGRIILRWIFRKLDYGASTGLIWLRLGTGGGHL